MAQEVNIPRIPGVRGISAFWARYMQLRRLMSGLVGRLLSGPLREKLPEVVRLSLIFTEMEFLCLEVAGPAYILPIISLILTTC